MDVAPSSKGFRGLHSYAALILITALQFSCNERPRPTGGGYVGGTAKVTAKEPKKLAAGTSNETPESATSPATTTAPEASPVPDAAPREYSELTQIWGLGELHDLAPAGPATATSEGVYFVTRTD
jgi:hypothetical protein